jgi:capsular polysaccharide export protein
MDSARVIAEIAQLDPHARGGAAIGIGASRRQRPAMRILQQAETLTPATSASGIAATTRLRIGGLPLPAGAVAALFPDFLIERGRAAAPQLPFATLDQGLLRAPPHGRAAGPCLSAAALAVTGPPSPADCLDPTRVLAGRGWESPELMQRSRSARQALTAAHVGGAWWLANRSELPIGEDYALAVLAEPPVAGGNAAPPEDALAATLDAALAENPPERVVILAPDRTGGGPLRGKLAAAAARGARVIAGGIDPWAAMQCAAQIYSAGGEIGFLALLAGRPVAAFGRSFYTGWGLTRDAAEVPRHGFCRTLDEVFAGNCLIATRYRDPFGNRPASFEDTLALLAEWRRIELANRRVAVCVGMSFWKRRRVADFLRSTAGTPAFRRTAAGAVATARLASATEPRAIAVWASRMPPGLAEMAGRHRVPLIRVEDGFVRSVGLGADFLPPASLVFDGGGMYYDPRSRSDLENLLAGAEFAPALIERAGRLMAQLVAHGVTKYNLAGQAPLIDMPAGVRRILVPGQVEDDLSVLFGGGEIRTNLALLERARAANPDAFILYKPHPDVLAGHRKGAVPEALARRFADSVVRDVSTAALLAGIDEVHTMTSLAGFEALLRRRQVTVYGRPFYAGWGLTADRLAIDRGRRLTLEELVAGALILYPRYLDPVTRLPCGPEVIIERLDQPELWRPGLLVQARRLQGVLARRLSDLRASLLPNGLARPRLRQ